MNDTFLTQLAINFNNFSFYSILEGEKKLKPYLTEEELNRYCKFVYLRRKLSRYAYDKDEPEGSELERKCMKELDRQYNLVKDIIDKISSNHKSDMGDILLSCYA